tara:strand:- start:5412 stop:5648 length:237 start_codon:yes stop_codon:yes gene_type:complete
MLVKTVFYKCKKLEPKNFLDGVSKIQQIFSLLFVLIFNILGIIMNRLNDYKCLTFKTWEKQKGEKEHRPNIIQKLRNN